MWLGNITAAGQKLYPVEGPLTIHTPQPVLAGHLKFRVVSAGAPFLLLKSWTLADGKVADGKVTTVKRPTLNMPAPGTLASYPPQPDLAFAWDDVYGQGYFVARMLGNRLMQGIFTGPQGIVLQVESLNGQNGVAVDNQGNIYKMVW
jgi:hypothetical protein